jgi:hypothetical protein
MVEFPASAEEVKLPLFDATFKHTAPLADMEVLCDPTLCNPVFESFGELKLGLVSFPSLNAEAPDRIPPTFELPDMPTPPVTTKVPVVVLLVKEVTVYVIVLAFPTVKR